MPYTKIYRKENKWCFKNKETGEERCSATHELAVSALRLLYGIEGGMTPYKAKE